MTNDYLNLYFNSNILEKSTTAFSWRNQIQKTSNIIDLYSQDDLSLSKWQYKANI